MANTKSAQKAWRKSLRRASINKTRRSDMRTHLKKARVSIEAVAHDGPVEQAQEALRLAQSKMMRRGARRVIPRKAASRRISRLAQRLKKMQSAS